VKNLKTKIENYLEKIETIELQCHENIIKKDIEQGILDFTEKLENIKKLKDLVKKQNKENIANKLLLEEFLIEADLHFLKFCKAFSTGNYGTAWDDLQTTINNYWFALGIAEQIGADSSQINEKIGKCKDIKDQYPRQLFASPGILVKRIECSICGKETQDCSHIKGRAYDGEMCVWIMKDVEIQELSLVTNPEDPRCRMAPLEGDFEKGNFKNFNKKERKVIMKKTRQMKNIIIKEPGNFTQRFQNM